MRYVSLRGIIRALPYQGPMAFSHYEDEEGQHEFSFLGGNRQIVEKVFQMMQKAGAIADYKIWRMAKPAYSERRTVRLIKPNLRMMNIEAMVELITLQLTKICKGNKPKYYKDYDKFLNL